MRPIIFRGKDKKTGKWFYGDLHTRTVHGRVHICDTSNGTLDADPDTIGQFIGLTDKSKTEVYEDDIVQCGVLRLRVVYNAPCFELVDKDGFSQCITSSWLNNFHRDIEVIGNFHDNHG